MADLRYTHKGRPKRTELIKRLKLRESTYDLWNQRKERLGIKGLTNSEFAEILLHQDLEVLRKRCEEQFGKESTPTPSTSSGAIKGKRGLFQSTPVGKGQLEEIGISPVVDIHVHDSDSCDTDKITDIDVTGGSTLKNVEDESVPHQTCIMAETLKTINPDFCSLDGNPFQEVNILDSSDEECPMTDIDENAGFQSDLDDARSEEEIEPFVADDLPMDSATMTALEIELHVPEVSGDEEAVSFGDITVNSQVQQFGPITLDAYKEGLKDRVKKELVALKLCSEDLVKYEELFRADRIVAEVDNIVELFETGCQEPECMCKRQVIEKKIEAGVLTIAYKCTKGHSGVWNSSSILVEKRGQKVFVSSVLLASAVLVSGNNFEKVLMLAKCLNLHFVSASSFTRIQSLYAVPSIRELWTKMKDVIWKVFKDDVLVLCGDGRMDSPGFSAKYCVYVMMDHYLNVIIDLEVVDKREAGGTSTLMEKMGCKRLLEQIIKELNLGELVTDASRVIMKMVRELKEKNCEILANLFHSLDIWHKSIKLTAKITSAGKIKGCDGLLQWVEPVRNHFWHCAEACGGDADMLKDMWIGVIHHACGEHEWDGGVCTHGPLTAIEGEKQYLAKDSKAADELRKIVFDKEWLKSLQHYVHFRHTSNLENFNSMLLKYAPKRIAFTYEAFTGRILLAALDHNFHLFRKELEGRFKKIYSKRSGNWRAEPVKEMKKYDYWGVLQADILRRRAEDKDSVVRHVEVSPLNPIHLAPTIAMKDAPSTSELVKKRLSRFKQQPKSE